MKTNHAFNAIAELDLEPIKTKLMHVESGEGWSRDKADAMETEYRRFLYLMHAFPNEETAPTVDVDTFWHYHILDTMKYAADCEKAFGYFLHHFPYLGMQGEADAGAEKRGGDRMRELYEQTFGEAYIRPEAYGASVSAYCMTRPTQSEKAACCIPLATEGARAAYCMTRPTDSVKAAYCMTRPTDSVKAAYCMTRPTDSVKAAYCMTRPTDSVKAAYCMTRPTDSAKAAYCMTRPSDSVKAAYCMTRPTDSVKAAYCMTRQSDSTKAAYCMTRTSEAMKAGEASTGISRIRIPNAIEAANDGAGMQAGAAQAAYCMTRQTDSVSAFSRLQASPLPAATRVLLAA